MYLTPLIDDLNTLWNHGVQAYDAYKHEIFNLKIMLFQTVNDSPTYGNLSGFSANGYKSCSICDKGTDCQYLQHSRNLCYMTYMKFLPRNHVYINWKNLLTVPEKDALICVSIDEDVFGLTFQLLVFKDDITQLCSMQEFGAVLLTLYMR